MHTNIQEGGLLEKYNDSDFLLGAENNYYLYKKNPNAGRDIVQFNQASDRIHRNSCTIFGNMGVVSYNTGLVFNQKEVEQASLQAIEDNIVDPAKGAYFVEAVDFTRKYCKSVYGVDLITYRIGTKSKALHDGLDNGRAFSIGYYTSIDIVKDTEEDGIADEKEYPAGSGHLVYYLAKEGSDYVINSYNGIRKYNSFRFKYFEELLDNIIFPFAYILLPTEYQMPLPTHIEPKAIKNHSFQQEMLERERLVQKAMVEKGYKTLYKNYIGDDEGVRIRILIEIAEIRKTYGVDF